MLNDLFDDCKQWKLKINVQKIKVMIIMKGRLSMNLKFNVDNYDIQIVNEYRYLGIIFSKSSSFFKENIYKKNLQKQCMGVTIIY